MSTDAQVHELAGGEIVVWQEDSGAIMLKCKQKYDDPVELGEEEALELAPSPMVRSSPLWDPAPLRVLPAVEYVLGGFNQLPINPQISS
jgi:hypothetical protein